MGAGKVTMAREKLCVGLDIGTSSVKMCQLKSTKRGLVLHRFGHAPLPADTIVDGSVMNSARVVDAVMELFGAQRIRNRQVAISVAGHAVIIKKLPMPRMSREELAGSIQWEAKQFIKFDMSDVHFDFQIVESTTTQHGQMDVVLVAAKKDFVSEYTAVVAEAGLEPTVCDVDVFALETMFAANYDVSANQTVVLVNVGAAMSNINIIARGVSGFTRDVPMGGNDFNKEVQKQLNVSYDEAEALKLGGTSGQVAAGNAMVPEEVERALQMVAEGITNEVQRSIDFYAATAADPPPERIYLSGGSARLPALRQSLQRRIDVPVEVINPFRQIDTSGHDATYLGSIAPAAAVAVGLAMRYPGDA